jgi:RHS repeat-associated protein
MYDGYGAKLGDTDAFTGNPEPTRDAMGFQGQFGAYTDTETGLVLMGHRYYDAGTGRFLIRDPLGYNGGINLCGFTGNNPVNESDPEGTQGQNGPNQNLPPLYDQNPAASVYDGTAEDQQEHPSTAAILSGRAGKSDAETATVGEGKSPNIFLNGNLPGQAGVAISRRPTVEELQRLTKKRKVEFAVTYTLGPGKNGGGGQYYLHSGTRTTIDLPVGGNIVLICHTHPGSTLEASPLDMGYMAHATAICHSPQKSSVIIPARGKPFRFGGKYGTGLPVFVCH